MYSKEVFFQQYQNLSNPDKTISSEANKYILNLQATKEAFTIAKQILDSDPSTEHQFIACQLIYRRLKEESDQSIQPYLLDLLQRELPIIALNQVCSSFALIIINDPELWNTILDQLMQLMSNKLAIGIEILSQIAIQGKEMFSKAKQIKLQSYFVGEREKLSLIFKALLKIMDIKIVNQAIGCIQAWIQFQYKIFDDKEVILRITELINEGIANSALEFISQLFELLTESIYFSEYANVNNLLTYNLEVSATLTSLLQFLLYIYNPNLPKTYAILCTKFACDFQAIYIDTVYEVQVFQLMCHITQNPSRTISFQTFQFWSDMQQNKKLKDYGLSILQTVIEKCKLKSIVLTKEFLSGEPEDDAKELNHLGETVLSACDYREHAKDLYYSIFNGLKDIGQESKYFEIVSQNMNFQQTNQSIILYESALFAILAVIDDIHLKGDNVYVYQIVNQTLNLPKQDTDIIIKTALQMFNEFTNQYIFYEDLFAGVVGLILHYMAHDKLGPLAAAAYEQISHQIEKIDVKIIDESILFLENNFRKFNSQSQVENYISALMNLSQRCNNIQIIYKLFQFVNSEFLKGADNEKDFDLIVALVLSPLTWINLNIESIDQNTRSISDQLCASITGPLIQMVSRINGNHYYTQIFKLFKIVLRISNYQQQEEGIIMLLTLSLQIFSQEPIQKAHWLSLLTNSMNRSAEFPCIKEWFKSKIENIHSFVIEQNHHWKDPDLMKYYVEFLKTIIQNDQNILLQSNELCPIIKEICDSLLTINSYEMQREIFGFFRTYTTNIMKDNQAYLNSLLMILQTLFYGIQDFNPFLLTYIQHVLTNLITQQVDMTILQQSIYQALMSNWGVNKEQKIVLLITKSILSLAKNTQRGDINKELRLLLSKLRPMYESEINYVQLELISRQ